MSIHAGNNLVEVIANWPKFDYDISGTTHTLDHVAGVVSFFIIFLQEYAIACKIALLVVLILNVLYASLFELIVFTVTHAGYLHGESVYISSLPLASVFLQECCHLCS